MEKFSKRLKELRQEKGLTQEAVSNATGISRSCIAMYELNQRLANITALIALADFFNVTLDYLTGRTDY